ncbi:DUF255 domain-containing protein [Streptomyces celluloflavus]|uniref:DUF255 domain-containing protein n=1 Tax=Streptomyces celluloflavus TaxID=58344 RepID=UPI0037AC978A
MPNHLAHETSPYLLQHADNPVDWWPWSTAAFEEARRGGVPVLFSGGYRACRGAVNSSTEWWVRRDVAGTTRPEPRTHGEPPARQVGDGRIRVSAPRGRRRASWRQRRLSRAPGSGWNGS